MPIISFLSLNQLKATREIKCFRSSKTAFTSSFSLQPIAHSGCEESCLKVPTRSRKSSSRGAPASFHERRNTPVIQQHPSMGQKHHSSLFPRGLDPNFCLSRCAPTFGKKVFLPGCTGEPAFPKLHKTPVCLTFVPSALDCEDGLYPRDGFVMPKSH